MNLFYVAERYMKPNDAEGEVQIQRINGIIKYRGAMDATLLNHINNKLALTYGGEPKDYFVTSMNSL